MNKFSSAFLALGIAFTAVNAHASVISGGSFTFAESTTEINKTGSLNLFDSNLGVLQSVLFTFTGSGTTQFTLTNNSVSEQTVEASSKVNLFYSSSNVGISALLAPLNPQVILDFTTGFKILSVGQTAIYGPYNDVDTKVQMFTTPISLTAFQSSGVSPFSLTCRSLSSISMTGGGGNVGSNQTTTAGCGAAISYTYSEITIPEPATLGLFGIGLLGFAASRRRKAA